MIDERFVILGAVLSIAGCGKYALHTVRGQAQPNRVTWFLWTTAPMIGFVAQLGSGVGLSSIMTLSVGLGPLIIFVASFANSASYWRISAFDIGCGLVSVAALVVWLSLDSPTVAVVFAILADLVAGVPTIRKAWRSPATETAVAYALSATNAAITLLTIDRWGVATWSFPVYIAALATSLFLIVQLRLGTRWRASRFGGHGTRASSARPTS